jgi:transcriptional regulator with XRE-family HTH domain
LTVRPDMPIGERIAYWRQRRGLTQRVLADLIGRSESWLSQVERGIRSVDRMSVMLDLASVLHVKVTELTGQPLSLAPNGGVDFDPIADIRHALLPYDVIASSIRASSADGEEPPTSTPFAATRPLPGTAGKPLATSSLAATYPI